ncbi:hypothetical protein PIROE2DRAFT_62101 [Piromyces sp. E2]|nr:hypothetical protein PIROE2DRAFT_62101 [Piromyces sp. E2]|eukprot:OUM62100.1 hypothetical protein PIROE2DRAFT_62101 [Piromyces sp. E2]
MSYLNYKLEKQKSKSKSKSPANLSSYINTYISSYIDNYLNNEEGVPEEKVRHEKNRFNYFGTFDDSFTQEEDIARIKTTNNYIKPVDSTKTHNRYQPVEKEEKYRFKTSYYNRFISDESRTSTPTLAESDNYSSTDNTNRNSEKTLTPQDGERDSSSFEEYYTPQEEQVYYYNERDTDLYSKESNVGGGEYSDDYSDEYANHHNEYRKRSDRIRGLFRDKVFYEKNITRSNSNNSIRDQYNNDEKYNYRNENGEDYKKNINYREEDDNYRNTEKEYRDDYNDRHNYSDRNSYNERDDYLNRNDHVEEEEEYRGRDRRENYKNSYRDYPRDNHSMDGSVATVGRTSSYRGSIRDSQSITESVATITRIPRTASLSNRLRANSPARSSINSVQFIQSPTPSMANLPRTNSVRSKQIYPEETPKKISFFNHPIKFIKN